MREVLDLLCNFNNGCRGEANELLTRNTKGNVERSEYNFGLKSERVSEPV